MNVTANNHMGAIDKGVVDMRKFNSGLTSEQIKARMTHFTRAQKTAERRRRAALAAAGEPV